MNFRYAAYKEMVITMAVMDVLLLGIGIWFTSAKLVWVLSVVLGFVASVAYLSGMVTALDKSVSLMEQGKSPDKVYRLHTVIRYVIMAAVLAVACISDYLNPIVVFVCLLFVKIAAYFNPVVHRLMGVKNTEEAAEVPTSAVSSEDDGEDEDILGFMGVHEDIDKN